MEITTVHYNRLYIGVIVGNKGVLLACGTDFTIVPWPSYSLVSGGPSCFEAVRRKLQINGSFIVSCQ